MKRIIHLLAILGSLIILGVISIIIFILMEVFIEKPQVNIEEYYTNNSGQILNISKKIISTNECQKQNKDNYYENSVTLPNLTKKEIKVICNSEIIAFNINNRTSGPDRSDGYLVYGENSEKEDIYDFFDNFLTTVKKYDILNDGFSNHNIIIGKDVHYFTVRKI